MTTGEKIKAARKKAGLTQRELGGKLGVAYQTLAQWENDLRNPKTETLKRIASALEMNWYELLSDDQKGAAIDPNVINSAGVPVKEINFNATPDFPDLEQKFREGTLAPEELLQYKKLIEEATANTHKAVAVAKERLQTYIDFLNNDGQVKVYSHASDYAKELTEIPKYQRQPPQEAAQVPSPPSEGKDTTQPENPPEGPQEGK